MVLYADLGSLSQRLHFSSSVFETLVSSVAEALVSSVAEALEATISETYLWGNRTLISLEIFCVSKFLKYIFTEIMQNGLQLVSRFKTHDGI